MSHEVVVSRGVRAADAADPAEGLLPGDSEPAPAPAPAPIAAEAPGPSPSATTQISARLKLWKLKPKGRKATVVDHARVRERVKAWLDSRPVPAAGDKAEEVFDQDDGDDDEEADDDAQSDADSEEDKDDDDDDEEAELGDDGDDEVPGDEGHAVESEDARKVYTEAARLFREIRQVAAGQQQPISTSRQRRPPQTSDFEFF